MVGRALAHVWSTIVSRMYQVRSYLTVRAVPATDAIVAMAESIDKFDMAKKKKKAK